MKIRVSLLIACLTWATGNAQVDDRSISGFWDFKTATPLENPATLGSRTEFTSTEAANFEKGSEDRAVAFVKSLGKFVGDEPWADRGQELTEGTRAALIIDPANGKLPPRTQYGDSLAGGWKRQMMADLSGPEDRTLLERCVYNPVAPVRPSFFNNNLRILETPTHVLIYVEMIHEARIVPIVEPPVRHRMPPTYSGESLGYWDQETFVVHTRNFKPQTNHLGTSPQLHLIERFTRKGSDQLTYQFTIDDPEVFDAPWTALQTFNRLDGLIYEYACHEGNSMDVMLRGARLADDGSS